MGKAIRASALVLLLACSANAGTMGNDFWQPPPPPPPTESVQGEGIMGNDSSQPQSTQGTSAEDLAETSPLVHIVLNLLTLL